MEKEQIISFIKTQLTDGKITTSDLKNIANTNDVAQKVESSRNLIGVFYGIGAIIAIIGVSILVRQHWDEIGFGGRIIVSLGISLVTYITALLLRKPEQSTISQFLFVISAALAPLGIYVLLSQANVVFDSLAQLLTAIILCLIFTVAMFVSKKDILTIIVVGFATWAYYALIGKIFGVADINGDYIKWATMILGISYLCIASVSKDTIKSVLNGLGTLAILGAGIFVGGSFDLIYIAMIFAAFYGSVYLKSHLMLGFAAIFLIAHIIKLTSKYFVDSVGWPVSLIVIGFLVIGIGYGTFYLNRRFIRLQ
jgi:uncharacterized membrane protein